MFEWLNNWFVPEKPKTKSKTKKKLENMTKKELEILARGHGIELDRRLKKDTLIKQVKKLKNKNSEWK